MIKKEISIPLTKVEDLTASKVRREDYALKRDRQNTEVNEAIAARLLRTMVKCGKCGKAFVSKDDSGSNCPQCQ